jgi:CheY-like chemotaxis protein
MSGKKILLIDDDADIRASLRILLENRKYIVSDASSGKEGLDKIPAIKPDLIVLDVMMETAHEGYSLNQIIKFQCEFVEYKDIPIIMLSSIQEDPFTRFGQSDCQVEMIIPDQYMTKPVDIPKFLALVQKLLKE